MFNNNLMEKVVLEQKRATYSSDKRFCILKKAIG